MEWVKEEICEMGIFEREAPSSIGRGGVLCFRGERAGWSTMTTGLVGSIRGMLPALGVVSTGLVMLSGKVAVK